ncbi:TPA: hypothetical protein ACGO0F_001293 [Streptococcus suis]
MSQTLQLVILERGSFVVKDSCSCHDWEVRMDYLNNDKSSFRLSSSIRADKGDFVLAKMGSGKYSAILRNGRLKPFYFGIVESNEFKENETELFSVSLYNLVNFDFPATKKSGKNVQAHMKTLLDVFLFRDSTKKADSISVRVDGEPISYSYQPSDPPTVTNMVEYFINIFKKYGVVWEVEWVGYDDAGQFVVSTVIGSKSDVLRFKNNVADFQNWSVEVTRAGYASENMVVIVDKETSDSESPRILSTWYINGDREITQSDVGVATPTRSKVYIYDTKGEDKPSYQSVAQSELSGSLYSHNISCDVSRNSQLLPFSLVEIGKQCDIYYDAERFLSILTGYSLRSDSGVISLTFGYIRNTLKNFLIQGG